MGLTFLFNYIMCFLHTKATEKESQLMREKCVLGKQEIFKKNEVDLIHIKCLMSI